MLYKTSVSLLLTALLVWCLASSVLAGGWSVTREQGRAWLRDPEGQLFYSLGVNTVNGGKAHPKNLGYFWERFHPDMETWARETRERLVTWGFNTLGGWSDPIPDLDLPLIPELDLGRNARLHWLDPFAPDALEQAVAVARRITAPYTEHPRLIGYFTDNEVGWWNAPLFSWYLAAEWGVHSKQVLWRLLHDHYQGRWDLLTADFVPAPEVRSFVDLKPAGAKLGLRPGGQGIRVVAAFTRLCAARYYELVHTALHTVQPDALVMGDRLPLYYNQDAVLASRGFVDVLSSNYNADEADGWVAPYYFEGLNRLSPAPVLVTEFFFAADENRSDNKNNGHLMHVGTQAERALGAAAAQAAFALFPNVLGAHWFQYYDEPTGGREDGEDFNMGLVDIHNRPYEELLAAMAPVNAQAAALHARSAFAEPLPGHAPVPVRRLARPADCMDNSLLDWPDKAGTRLVGFTTPEPYVPFGDVHLAWSPEGLSLFNLASNYVDLFLLVYQGEFPLSEAYQLHIVLELHGTSRHFAVHLLPRPHAQYEGRFELEPRLYEIASDGSLTRLDTTGLLQALDKPLPHVALELFLPARFLGVEALAPGDTLHARLFVTSFYRELTMSFDHVPDAAHGRSAEVPLPRTLVLAE